MLLYSALYSVSLLKVSISSHEVLIEELGTYIWFKEVEYVKTFTNYYDKTNSTHFRHSIKQSFSTDVSLDLLN